MGGKIEILFICILMLGLVVPVTFASKEPASLCSSEPAKQRGIIIQKSKEGKTCCARKL